MENDSDRCAKKTSELVRMLANTQACKKPRIYETPIIMWYATKRNLHRK